MSVEHIIELKGIKKRFEDNFEAVKDFNLQVKKGEFVTFLGPSGCGKTTTLRMIAGIDIPTEGQILLNGEDISKLPPNKRPINTVFQRYALFPHLNIFDNIAFGLKIQKKSKKFIKERVNELVKLIGLEGLEKRYPSQLSGGQKQRCACARAIINNPKLLLADEPTGALDSHSSQMLLSTIQSINEQLRATILMVTHDAFTASYASRILFLKDGEIFMELRKGNDSRSDFFDKILNVLTMIGGGQSHVC